MSNSFTKRLGDLGLSIKKEVLFFIILNVLMILPSIFLVVFKVPNFLILIYIIFIPFADFFYFSRYKSIETRIKNEHNNEFINLLSYFEIFISNHNNVYQSLKMLLPYSSSWMSEKIESLLSMIDRDKSVAPFITFSHKFTLLTIENVMISIFQMVEMGNDEGALTEFHIVFSSLSDALYKNKIDALEKSSDSLNAFPLLGAGLVTITLILAIVSVLGDITNVI